MSRKKATKTKKKESKDIEKQLVRALADYDNLRKRFDRERINLEKLAGAKLAVKMLTIFDMLEEAQKHLKDSGIALTLEEFGKILREEGIERIKAEPGDEFNTELYEAVEVVKGGKSGKIADVVLTGWQFSDGPVIRPTKVKVNKK